MNNEILSIFHPDPAPLKLTFLILDGASIMCVASAIDPLRAANRVAGEKLFDWSIPDADAQSRKVHDHRALTWMISSSTNSLSSSSSYRNIA